MVDLAFIGVVHLPVLPIFAQLLNLVLVVVPPMWIITIHGLMETVCVVLRINTVTFLLNLNNYLILLNFLANF